MFGWRGGQGRARRKERETREVKEIRAPPYALRSLISLGLSFGSSLSSLAAHQTA